jgi:transposase
MANKSIGSIMIREIIRMKDNGLSNNQISKSIGKSRTTIIKYLGMIEASGICFKELLELKEEDLSELFEVSNELNPANREQIHKDLHSFFPYLEKELKRVGVTRHILWSEYKTKHPEGVMYSQFCEHYNKWNRKSEGYMPTTHKAGEKLFIDYAGKKLHIIDRETGEIKPVEVFVATLGASQYTYVEASFSQQIPDFIGSVQNCLHYLGGVPACIIPDNLKSAVTKSNKYEPHVNEQFASFARHYDTSIMPARALKPKDKSLVEGAVNITYTRIHAALRDKEFYSIAELNLAIKELLLIYNQTPFQKKQNSRTGLFLEIEKDTLKPLPLEVYELRDYKIATVQKNCHVYYSPDKNYYSIPNAYIGKKVKMVLTQSIVEIYHNQARIALHPRSRKAYHYVTLKEHMPVSHTYNSDWSSEYFITWAQKLGLSTKEYIEKILDKKQYPEQSYKSCAGILNMCSKVGKERLNNACKRALGYDAISYNSIKNILERGLDKEEEQLDLFNVSVSNHDNIRGSKYYS